MSVQSPTCANCGEPVAEVLEVADRPVCDAACAFQVLAASKVANAVGCSVCGEEFEEGRVPLREGYREKTCERCAFEIESRTPRGSA